MTGWLIVNEYLNTDKFKELRNLFMVAAKNRGIFLHTHTNAEFVTGCDGGVYLASAFGEIDDNNPDFVIFYDKDIELARALEDEGISVFNSANAIEICDSKYKMAKEIFRYNEEIGKLGGQKILTPATYKVPFTYENIGINREARWDFLEDIEKKIGYPMVIKESYSSFGMGVHLASDREEAIEIICNHGSRECVIQEYIECVAGYGDKTCENSDVYEQPLEQDMVACNDGKSGAIDIRLQMVSDKCVAAMMRSNDHDFRANITNGGIMSKYKPSDDDLSLAQEVMKALKLDFAGIDIMHKNCGNGQTVPVFCEANSNAHFKNLYDLTGINAAEDMLKYIEDKLS